MVVTLELAAFFLGFVTAGLGWCIAYLMLVSFRTLHQKYLLGFPLGFSLLGLSFASFGASNLAALPENLTSWLALFFGTYGYLSICLSYALKGDREADPIESRRSQLISITLTVLTVVVATVLYSIPILPSYQVAYSAFRVVNLTLLGYIIYNLNLTLQNRTELSSVVLGFTFLAIQQCSELIWALDRTFVWAFLFAQLVALVGMLVLAIVVIKGFRSE